MTRGGRRGVRTRGWSRVATIEANRPSVDRMDPQVGIEPRIALQHPADHVLGLGLDRHHDTELIAEWTSQDDEAFLNERIHDVGMCGEP
jgi:hypothetical protein